MIGEDRGPVELVLNQVSAASLMPCPPACHLPPLPLVFTSLSAVLNTMQASGGRRNPRMPNAPGLTTRPANKTTRPAVNAGEAPAKRQTKAENSLKNRPKL